jgi:hypothetical protein
MADVVERFQAQAAHECRITNNDGDLFAAATHVTRQRETLSDGDAGSSVPTIEHVVGRLSAAREAADTAELAERAKSGKSTGEQLVRIRLVPSIKDDAVDRRVHHAMQGDR